MFFSPSWFDDFSMVVSLGYRAIFFAYMVLQKHVAAQKHQCFEALRLCLLQLVDQTLFFNSIACFVTTLRSALIRWFFNARFNLHSCKYNVNCFFSASSFSTLNNKEESCISCVVELLEHGNLGNGGGISGNGGGISGTGGGNSGTDGGNGKSSSTALSLYCSFLRLGGSNSNSLSLESAL